MKPTLELPITLSVPKPNELPATNEIINKLIARKSANIIQGYKIIPNDPETGYKEYPFDFYAEINIDNSKLWSLFKLLCIELPKNASLLFGENGYKLDYGKEVNVDETLSFLENYKTEITADPFLEIGFIFQSDDQLVEVLIESTKYIKFWGVNLTSFYQIMCMFGLKEIPNIEFVDRYPLERNALRLFHKNIINTTSFLRILKEKYL